MRVDGDRDDRPGEPVVCSGHPVDPCEAFSYGAMLGMRRARKYYPTVFVAGGLFYLGVYFLAGWIKRRYGNGVC